MDTKKVPYCEKPDIDSLDIFLFTNGQQHTPPRKYHLLVNELNKWEVTLKTLAQSQYGTAHPVIDLYTIEGQKLTTPIEVIKNNTYVAVLPKDEFIPAGYTEYLLKASRSREKRSSKFKKPNNVCSSQVCPITGKVAAKDDITRNKLTNDSGKGRMKSPSEYQPMPTSQSQNTTRNRISSKPLHSRINNSMVLRRNISDTPNSMIPRTSLKSKENLSRKNLRVSPGRDVNKNPVLDTNHNNPYKPNPKGISKMGKDNTSIDNQKRKKGENDVSNSKDSLNSLCEKNCLTDSSLSKHKIDVKEVIDLKNPDSINSDTDKPTLVKQTSLSTVMPVIEENKTTKLSKEEITPTVINNYVENVYDPESTLNNQLSSKNQDKGKICGPLMPQDHPINNNSNAAKSDNFKAVIDKGDDKNLNFKDDASKADGMISAHNNTDSNYIHTLFEKNSQVEIDETFVQLAEKIPHGSNINAACNHDNKTTITLHCGLCDHILIEILPKNDNSLNSDGKQYIFLVSDTEFFKELPMCKCDQEITAQQETTHLNTSNAVKKIFTDTSLLKINKKGVLTSDNPNFDNTVSQVQSNIKDIHKDEKIQNQDNTNDKEFSLRQITLNLEKIPQKSTESEIIFQTTEPTTKTNAANISKEFVDNFTQTEWTSILLEARLHKDGRYSFHFPPLQLLKYYSL